MVGYSVQEEKRTWTKPCKKKTLNNTKINMERKISGRGHSGKKRQECKRLHKKRMEKGRRTPEKEKDIQEKETGITVEELRKVAESGKMEEREQRGDKNQG